MLDDGTAALSERGTADLLDLDHKALQNIKIKGIPKIIKESLEYNSVVATTLHKKMLGALENKDFVVATTLVKVTADGSPHKGRYIDVYPSSIIESLIRGYSLALGYQKLQKNQYHIGLRCIILQLSMAN